MSTTRVSTFAMHNTYVSNIMKGQSRLNDAETQVNTEMKSQTYSGLGSAVFRLVNMENQREETQHYMDANTAVELRLNMTQNSLTAISATAKDFKSRLTTYQQNNTGETNQVPDQSSTDNIQQWAWDALQQMKDYLNTQADGQYIFAGAKTQTKPVTLGDPAGNTFSTLEDFQSYYTGVVAPPATDAYPTTRDANLGTGYYHGDNQKLSYRIDKDRELQTGISATDPAFEKAMRAMAMIAQGPQSGAGPASGLSADTSQMTAAQSTEWKERVEQAMWLIGDAMDADTTKRTSSVASYPNAENPSDLSSLGLVTGYNQNILKDTATNQTNYISFLNTQCDGIEKADTAEAAVRMQDEKTALEASYAAISMVKDLSLVKYMS